MFWVGPIFWSLLLAAIYLWARREQSRRTPPDLTPPARPTRERDARNARIPWEMFGDE